jgi:hypothetical protein
MRCSVHARPFVSSHRKGGLARQDAVPGPIFGGNAIPPDLAVSEFPEASFYSGAFSIVQEREASNVFAKAFRLANHLVVFRMRTNPEPRDGFAMQEPKGRQPRPILTE